jgi:hypothetical protein
MNSAVFKSVVEQAKKFAEDAYKSEETQKRLKEV